LIRSPSGSSVYTAHLPAEGASLASPLRLEDSLLLALTAEEGVYALDVTVRTTQSSEVVLEAPSVATFTVAPRSDGAGPCSGTSVFCDDFASAPPPAYQLQRGTWTRVDGHFTASHAVAWERARALRWAAIIEEVIPQANKVWCVNKDSSPGHAFSRDLWPGKAYVDVYSVDWYNNYPWVSTATALTEQFAAGPYGEFVKARSSTRPGGASASDD
jgi:hypothetical protein